MRAQVPTFSVRAEPAQYPSRSLAPHEAGSTYTRTAVFPLPLCSRCWVRPTSGLPMLGAVPCWVRPHPASRQRACDRYSLPCALWSSASEHRWSSWHSLLLRSEAAYKRCMLRASLSPECACPQLPKRRLDRAKVAPHEAVGAGRAPGASRNVQGRSRSCTASVATMVHNTEGHADEKE